MHQGTAATIENVLIAERTYRIRLHAPEIAAAIRPGQFVMLRLPGTTDPLLGRPFALYDVAGSAIDIVYLVVGKLTTALAAIRPGEPVAIWGPLGNGFLDLGDATHVTLVAGGIGQTPFLAYARQLLGEQGYGGEPPLRRAAKVSLYYGVRTANLVACLEDFARAGVTVHLATDDGTGGRKGFVTQLLESHDPPGPWIGCGPEPMLRALMELAADRNVVCHVSLETPMACGFGVCFSCVTRVTTAGGWDYRRVCVDGPVFDARDLAAETPC